MDHNLNLNEIHKMINQHDCPNCYEPITLSNIECDLDKEMDYSVTYIYDGIYQCPLCCSEFSPTDIGEENE
jgi:hypothetical protein